MNINNLSVRTLSGGEFAISPEQLKIFRNRLRGPLYLPGEPAYEQSRTVWNAMIDRKPALVVRCLGVADVIEAVRFAHQNDLLMCIKGGGHNIAGLAVADDALMLDMSLMRGAWVEPSKKIVHAHAGCLLGDVDRETQTHGLSTVLGFVSLTGIAGLTLGGGFGWLTRRWGWTVDNVVGMDVVTAEGTLVKASSEENPDLFWALRGGGGNFGVVTGIDYTLYPIGPTVIGGFIAWPARDAPSVYALYKEISEKSPPELTLALNLRQAPPVPWIAREYHGRPVVMIGACYSGKTETGAKLVDQLRSFNHPVGDSIVPQSYNQLQTVLDTTQPHGRRNYWKSENLAALDPEFGDRLIEATDTIPSPYSSIILMQVDGKLNEYPENHSPIGNRDAHQVLLLAGSWENSHADNENLAWVRYNWKEAKPYTTGGTYLNFLSEDDGEDRLHAALRGRMDRLSAIKKRWDPDNMFRTNHNILPV